MTKKIRVHNGLRYLLIQSNAFWAQKRRSNLPKTVNEMFSEHLRKTMEVYIEDMHAVVNKYGMKINPTKCSFGVFLGKFLDYFVTQRRIEANPNQVSALIDMPSPRTKREVHKMIK